MLYNYIVAPEVLKETAITCVFQKTPCSQVTVIDKLDIILNNDIVFNFLKTFVAQKRNPEGRVSLTDRAKLSRLS